MPRKLPTSLLAAALAFAVLVLADAPAYAAFPTAQFTATAQVNANCTVTESGTLDFATYDPLVANATVAQPGSGASLSVRCTRGSLPVVSLDDGIHLAGSAFDTTRRSMTTGVGGANKALAYDLLQPSGLGASSATATTWGAGGATGATFSVGASVSTVARTVQIFGSIPGGQDVITGTYNDTVTATVQF
jgi:spore coat protein U-like protein